MSIVTRPDKTVLSLVLMLSVQQVSAGLLWECTFKGEVLSRPVEVKSVTGSSEYEFMFRGESVTPDKDAFCKDRIGKTQKVRLSASYYKYLKSPSVGHLIVITEYQEENDYGQGLMRWRYFAK